MGLLLLRHADAIAAGRGLEDAARWLSPHGRRRAEESAKALKSKGIGFDHCLTSPRVRAVQTAEIFARVLGFEGAVEVLPSLSFTVPARDALRELKEIDGNVLAVGHMPTLAEIARLLCPTEPLSGFETAEARWIEGGQTRWSSGAEPG